jgi:hypothetical protein
VGVAWLLLGTFIYPGGEGWGYDARAYLDAADRLMEGGSPYQSETLSGPYRPGPYGLYMYAPPLAVALTPLAATGEATAILIWYAGHLLALGLACLIMPVRPAVRLAVFGVAALSYAVSIDAVLGNISTLLLLLLAIAWRWLDRPAGALATAVAIAVRPTLAIIPVWQGARRQWRSVLWTALGGVILVLATLPFVGIEGYTDYLSVLRNLSDVTGVPRNLDLASTTQVLGLDAPWPNLALLSGYVLAVGAVALSLRHDREVGFIVAASASLLLSPLLWNHYLTILVLPAAMLANRGRPLGLLLPLLTWLPGELQPFLAILGTWAPLMAREPMAVDGERRRDPGSAAVTRSPA